MAASRTHSKRPGRHPELDRTITVAGTETTVFDAAIERMRTGIPIIQSAASLGVRMQLIHEWRRSGVRLRQRQISGEVIDHPDELRLIEFADRCDTAEAEAYAIDWTRHGRVAAGGLEQRRTTTTVKTDDAGQVVSRTTVEQVEQTLPHEGALRWRLQVLHPNLRQRVEVSGPDGGPIPVEATAAALAQRLAAFVDATAVEVDGKDSRDAVIRSGPEPSTSGSDPDASSVASVPRGSGMSDRMMDWPSPDVDVPPPAG